MDETTSPSDSNSNELSVDDLAVLQAFHAMGDPELEETVSAKPISESPLKTQPLSTTSPASPKLPPDDMLSIFVSEAEEAFATMRHALDQLEQDDRLDSPAFSLLQRTAHKLKGTAGSIGYEALSILAHYVEALVELVQSGTLIYLTGLITLIRTVHALEMTLQNILTDGQES
jgi:HPt (histidine-containing phosphotransfer) domain-containing protein